MAGIHTSISSGIVTEPGEMQQVIKDGVMHIITDGFEYEMDVVSTWDNGFDILGGKGYIVNVAEGGMVGFIGARWSNQPPAMAAPRCP